MNTNRPQHGFLRVSQILQDIPIGKSTWWLWVKTGKAPQPIKLGKNTTVWKASDIEDLITKLSTESEV